MANLKVPLVFMLYTISGVATLQYVIPTVAILIILITTFCFYWFVIKNLPTDLKSEYEILLKVLKKRKENKKMPFLCIIALNRSRTLQMDLKERLSNIEETDLDLFYTGYGASNKKGSYIMAHTLCPFWREKDYDSRITFITRVIKRL